MRTGKSSLKNLVPRVFGPFGQRVSTRRDSGIMDIIFPENPSWAPVLVCMLQIRTVISYCLIMAGLHSEFKVVMLAYQLLCHTYEQLYRQVYSVQNIGLRHRYDHNQIKYGTYVSLNCV